MSENKSAKTPADDPVAWRIKDIKQVVLHAQGGSGGTGYIDGVWYQPEQQEPVAWISDSPTKGNGKQLHWTKAEAWRWSSNITPLYAAQPKQWVGLTEREVELIDEMIETQLLHAERCDHMANSTMAQKQKVWNLERVELLRKLKEKNK